jgi:predicted HTH domain antitoxin
MNDNIENHLTLTQKYIILLLSANNNEPIIGKVWFQKELFLISQNLPRLEEEAEFEGSLLGPFSENANAELDQLQIEDLAALDGKIRLTPKGIEAADRLKLKASKETLELVSDMKSFINDLTEDEMLAYVYFSYPDMTLESIILERIRKKRVEIAVSLYRKRKVSIGKAAFIAGVSQEDFIRKAQESGISVFSE